MAEIVNMPRLSLTMTEGKILKWYKKEGDKVDAGESLVEIETDKAKSVIEAPTSGILKKIVAAEGEKVPIIKPIAVIGGEDEPLPDLSEEIEVSKDEDEKQKAAQVKNKKQQPSVTGAGRGKRVKASPAAKRIAKEKNINLELVTPSGPGGRILEKDIRNYIEEQETAKEVTEYVQEGPAEVIPLEGIREAVAKTMSKSKSEAPHFYLKIEVDMSNAMSLRERIKLRDGNEERKLSFNDILIKVAAKALEENPRINSRLEDDRIIINSQVNIGLAVALEEGLVVPVIKNVNRKGLGQISRESKALVKKAREGNLYTDDYQNGSFTISNLGMYDIDDFLPIINPPESAIIGVGKIAKVPKVSDNGDVFAAPVMKISFSGDHRVIDGAQGAIFLKRIKDLLENPFDLLV